MRFQDAGATSLLSLALLFPSAATELSSTLSGRFLFINKVPVPIQWVPDCSQGCLFSLSLTITAQYHYQTPAQFPEVSLLSLSARTLSL